MIREDFIDSLTHTPYCQQFLLAASTTLERKQRTYAISHVLGGINSALEAEEPAGMICFPPGREGSIQATPELLLPMPLIWQAACALFPRYRVTRLNTEGLVVLYALLHSPSPQEVKARQKRMSQFQPRKRGETSSYPQYKDEKVHQTLDHFQDAIKVFPRYQGFLTSAPDAATREMRSLCVSMLTTLDFLLQSLVTHRHLPCLSLYVPTKTEQARLIEFRAMPNGLVSLLGMVTLPITEMYEAASAFYTDAIISPMEDNAFTLTHLPTENQS